MLSLLISHLVIVITYGGRFGNFSSTLWFVCMSFRWPFCYLFHTSTLSFLISVHARTSVPIALIDFPKLRYKVIMTDSNVLCLETR